jgi:large subunit ribosomal protein L21
MYAIVATGGKQLKVATGDVVTVEKLDAAAGENVTFDVIFLADEDTIVVDPTELASAQVTGEVLEHFKGEKAIIFKFKKRKGYKRLKGHRQLLTKVRITDVSAKAAPKKAAATRKKKTEEPAEVVAETAEAAAQD